MNEDNYLTYAVAAVAAGGIAVWAGLPPYLLLLLACPVMMLLMMSSMGGGKGRNDADSSAGQDGSHDRGDRP